MTSPFDYVSYDLLTHFFENYLDAASVVTCKLTCRHFHKLLARIVPKGWRTNVIQDLAYIGMSLVEWFHEKLAYPSNTFLIPCAKSGNLEVFQWAYRKGTDINRKILWSIYESAIARDYVDIIDWLFSMNLTECIGDDIDVYADDELLQEICMEAANAGSTDVLDWCSTRGMIFEAYLYGHARYRKSIEWVYNTTKLALPKFLLRAAVVNNDLELMEWLYDHQCPLSIGAATKAARRGNLKVLQWLHQRGCPWDEQTAWRAALSGHPEVALWALQNGCPRHPDLDDAMITSCADNDESESLSANNSDSDSD